YRNAPQGGSRVGRTSPAISAHWSVNAFWPLRCAAQALNVSQELICRPRRRTESSPNVFDRTSREQPKVSPAEAKADERQPISAVSAAGGSEAAPENGLRDRRRSNPKSTFGRPARRRRIPLSQNQISGPKTRSEEPHPLTQDASRNGAIVSI